jgi:phenylacetate-CoA ligase
MRRRRAQGSGDRRVLVPRVVAASLWRVEGRRLTQEAPQASDGQTGGLDLSIIVPCYNEEANLRELVGRLVSTLDLFQIRAEIILIDDKSRDGSRAVIQELAAAHPAVVAVFHPENRGIAGGWRSGLAAARAPLVAITDADLQYAPEDLPRLYQILKREGADIIQGWRIAKTFKGAYRYVLSIAFSALLNLLLGTRLRDIKSGFLCTKREVFAAMLETHYRYRYLQHFIVVNAVSKGYGVRQEPILFWDRHAGQSFISSPLRFGLSSLPDLPRAFWEFRVRNRRLRAERCAA